VNDEFHSKFAETLFAAGAEPVCQCVDPATGERVDGIEIWHAADGEGKSTLLVFNRRGAEANVKIDGKMVTLPQDVMVVM